MLELYNVPGVAATVKPRYYVINYYSIDRRESDRRDSQGHTDRSSGSHDRDRLAAA